MSRLASILSAFLAGASAVLTKAMSDGKFTVSSALAAVFGGLVGVALYLITPAGKAAQTANTAPTFETHVQGLTPMATTETATLTISSPAIASPIVLPLAKESYSLPITGTATVTATSAAGTTLVENVTAVLSVDGLTVYNGTLSKFPVDLGFLGTLLEEADLTLSLSVVAA